MKYPLQLFSFSILKTFTAELFLMFCLVLVNLQVLGQVSDNFTDGDFTDHPPWSGDNDKFTVTSNVLTLAAAPAAGLACLVTSSPFLEKGIWEFMVKLDFNPSPGNQARIYLVSDQPDLDSALNGYFVMIGNASDDISLYRQTGTAILKIIDGIDGITDLPRVEAKIKVTRDTGLWQLFSDIGLTGTYTLEGTVLESSHQYGQYFGIYCAYTATRSDKFFFDDILVSGTPLTDLEPPALERIKVGSGRELELSFSEILDRNQAENISAYRVDNNIDEPLAATLLGDLRTVTLTFANDFPESISCNLTVAGVKDLHGNTMVTTTYPFIFYQSVQPQIKDIIISEVFPDPSPTYGLPEGEFVEVLNRSGKAFNMKDWTLTDGHAEASFPDVILGAGEYLILASTAQEGSFSSFGKSIGLTNFPSLNNASDVLILRDQYKITIDSIHYFSTWYKDDEKKEGGWSLEIIDPNNVCSEGDNWTASESEQGGTPGKQNSVLAEKPDLTGPYITSVFPLGTDTIRISFNEKLEHVLPSPDAFVFQPSVMINQIRFKDKSLTAIDIVCSPLNNGTLYQLTANRILDCSGNLVQESGKTGSFALPEMADPMDVVINEILFNPRPGGVDFVEIVNASNKYIDLKDWAVGNFEDQAITNVKVITPDHYLLKPGQYVVLTENKKVLKSEYLHAPEENMLEVALPGLGDDEGSVALADGTGKLIDHLSYSDDFHSVFIKDDEGVSLERISFQLPSDDVVNWKSGSSRQGYATPGYVNANARTEPTGQESAITVAPEIFIPVTGQPDHTLIHYQFEAGGNVANLSVYDARGHPIKRIANNEILGTNGYFRWDGDRDDGNKARMGYYMLCFEIFNAEGEVQTIRKRIAIAATLN